MRKTSNPARATLGVAAVLLSVAVGQQPLDIRSQGPPHPVDPDTRTKVVQKLADELESTYVDPDVAKKMAESLRSKLAAKGYDANGTGESLAKQLTEEMQAISRDKHLRVTYADKALPQRIKDRPTPGQTKKMQEMTRRRNAGFVKLERLPGNIGLLVLRGFADPKGGGAETAATAMNFLAGTDALIIDLRRNGGGSGEMVQLLCSYLLSADKPVHINSFYWRKGDRTEEFWTVKDLPGKRYLGRDVYVLTSKATFSAAEEFAYDVKNLKRATLVGETTGGGAHPGGIVPLGDHFAAFIATGRAINPVTKTNWEGTGVKPDVEVDADRALDVARELALTKLRKQEGGVEAKEFLENDLRAEERFEKFYQERKSR